MPIYFINVAHDYQQDKKKSILLINNCFSKLVVLSRIMAMTIKCSTAKHVFKRIFQIQI